VFNCPLHNGANQGERRKKMEKQEVCYTFETALEKAIEMERESHQAYKSAYFKINDPRVKAMIKNLVFEELDHINILEKALFEETVSLHGEEQDAGPSMKLTLLMQQTPLHEESTDQDVLAYAVHDKKRAVDFYQSMTEQCAGAPMEKLFRRLYQDEESHLARLEELYESVYMPDM
jgi:rubrerythrin